MSVFRLVLSARSLPLADAAPDATKEGGKDALTIVDVSSALTQVPGAYP